MKESNVEEIKVLLTDKPQEEAKNLTKELLNILEASSKIEITSEVKNQTIEKVWKLLNEKYQYISENISQDVQLFNKYQQIFFSAINHVNKLLQNPKIKINNNLFRVYCCVLFERAGKSSLLQQITGWDFYKVMKEPLTRDIKVLIVSMTKAPLNEKDN